MDDKAPIIYGLEFPGRALAARVAETERIQFFCGTQSLKHENQVHLIEYDEELLGIDSKTVFQHLCGEIWHLSSSPTDVNIIATCYSHVVDNQVEMGSSLWRLPPEDIESQLNASNVAMEKICDLKHDKEQSMKCVLWCPVLEGANSTSAVDLCSVSNQCINLWSLQDGPCKLHSSVSLDASGRQSFSCACWNPHSDCTQLLTGVDNSIKTWDLRTKDFNWTLDNAHSQVVRGMDHNPNQMYHFATCGDDCCAKFWDARKLEKPLITRQDHSHWVWSVRFNPHYDQLVLTSSSDSQVVLTRLASIASEPVKVGEEDDTVVYQPQKDMVIQKYDEHEDSVYSVEWSSADRWTFASLSYDGRMVINHVPSSEKFSILMPH